MTSFYIAQRKRLGILLNKGKPEGGKWTFDTENREPLPATVTIPQSTFPASNAYVNEAIDISSTVYRTIPEKHHPSSTVTHGGNELAPGLL